MSGDDPTSEWEQQEAKTNSPTGDKDPGNQRAQRIDWKEREERMWLIRENRNQQRFEWTHSLTLGGCGRLDCFGFSVHVDDGGRGRSDRS